MEHKGILPGDVTKEAGMEDRRRSDEAVVDAKGIEDRSTFQAVSNQIRGPIVGATH